MVSVHTQTATGGNYPPTPDTIQPGANPQAGPQEGEPDFSAAFADTVAYMDKMVGKVDRALRDAGVRENTILIFLGDNGTPKGIVNRFRGRPVKGGKLQLTEAGTRVPLIVNWPAGAQSGRVIRDLTDIVDVMPTLLAAIGVPLPAGYDIDGRSFLSQLKGEQTQPREWIYKQINQSWMIRDSHYRLNSDGRLWDLSADAYQPTLAADSPATVATRERLGAVVKKLHKDDRQ
jgi:arylsulfatase A